MKNGKIKSLFVEIKPFLVSKGFGVLRKAVTAGLLFLIPVLILALVYVIKTQNSPVNGGNPENNDRITEAVVSITLSPSPTPVVPPAVPELMAELNSGKKTASDEGLKLLTNEESALGYFSNLILAYRYEQEGKDASEYYRAALELYPTDEIRFRLADHLLNSKRFEEAEQEYLVLLPDEKAYDALTGLKADPEKVCEAYAAKKEWKALEEYLKRIFDENPGTDADTALMKHYAQALFEQGNYKEALPFYEKLYEQDETDSGIAWLYARCLESAGRSSTALKVYSSLGEKGAYRRGIILQKQGKNMEAADAFAASNEAVSIWQAARIWDAAGMFDKAVEAYTRVASLAGSYQDDAAYRAYILSKRLGRNDVDKLIEVLSYHPAWMVRVGKEPLFPQVNDISYHKPEYLKQAAIYEKDGYTEAALIEVAIGSRKTSLEEKLALGDWYLERGEYYNAVLWGIRSLSEQPTRRGYELAYPQLFEEHVLEASEKYNLDPALIWAVIREESHFRHDAVSLAGAMGLMQIMPATGKDIASRLGMTITDNDLLNPEISIKFGSFYISSMMNMFNADIDRAMAAYNGGPGNVRKWLESSFMTSDEDFPTAVTFLETQEYITKVRNSYHIYKWLYD